MYIGDLAAKDCNAREPHRKPRAFAITGGTSLVANRQKRLMMHLSVYDRRRRYGLILVHFVVTGLMIEARCQDDDLRSQSVALKAKVLTADWLIA